MCSEGEALRYTRRISGPLADRIDLYIAVDRVPLKELVDAEASESSAAVRARVADARGRQHERNHALGLEVPTNARLHARDLLAACGLSPRRLERARVVAERLGLSARAWHRMLRVARTIADLEGADIVGDPHLLEALRYRRGHDAGVTGRTPP
ncbi:MAG: hypothetical protein GKS06_17540 [Acidobacteria bacterium]|nr:hypothetical protein [Acidobacteriota bacterium]